MPSKQPEPETQTRAPSPQAAQNSAPVKVDPLSQSPDAPIVFAAKDDVARGNMERANAEPEPAALHSAKTPGVPDQGKVRRKKAAKLKKR